MIIFILNFTSQNILQQQDSDLQDIFETWFMKNRRIYQNEVEKNFRFQIFLKNYQLIQNHNQQGHSYTLDLNNFADFTDEEFRRFYSNTSIKNLNLQSVSLDHLEDINLNDIQQEIDWSDKYNQGKPKNQLYCGSCYIFSAVGLAELDYAIKNNTNVVNFSEQQLLDCGYQMGLNDCNGGSPSQAAQFLSVFGAIKEQTNPYVARRTQCRNYQPFYKSSKPLEVHNTSVKNLIKLLNKGPVVVSMEITLNLKFYKFGIYDSKAPCGFFDDHGMLAVGYNLQQQYIILRNSWGPAWGQQGYMKWYFGDDLNDVGPCGTGAIGSLFLQQMKNCQDWNQVFVVTRKMNELLQQLQEDKRFHIIQQQNILDTQTTLQNGVYNFLGSQVKHGKETFTLIDKTYVLQSCDFAKQLNAKHFMHITSKGSDKNSMFLYLKTKGEVEEELKKKEVQNISVLKPGLIKNRPNARFVEKLGKCIPFVDKIDAIDLAKYAHELTLKILQQKRQNGFEIYDHKKIEKKIYEQLQII